MALQSLSDRLEDDRFRDVKIPKKKYLPTPLIWFLKEDYLTDEAIGVRASELEKFKQTVQDGHQLICQATDKVLNDQALGDFAIPAFMHECIQYSWRNKDQHPFMAGRYDINGGFGKVQPRIIEFNADSFSTLPETLLWQDIQHHQINDKPQFNHLEEDLKSCFNSLKQRFGNEMTFMGTSLGYKEDVINVGTVVDVARSLDINALYSDLEHLVFSEGEGAFLQTSMEEYLPLDVIFKLFPWDWIFNDEPGLAKILCDLVIQDKLVVLNPAYTTLWQNKLFLGYLSQLYPDNQIFAKTYYEAPQDLQFISKPVYGRLGENVHLISRTYGVMGQTKGDYKNQQNVFQEYIPLAIDRENYFYQTGMFYTDRASALNFRCQDDNIITDDCEFMTHFII